MKKAYSFGAMNAALLFFITLQADAALVSKLDGKAVYDDDLGITWIADASLSATNTFGLPTGVRLAPSPDYDWSLVPLIWESGKMDWVAANLWIDAMNSAKYLGYNDWRLPDTLQPDYSCETTETLPSGTFRSSGLGCTGSELGHLYDTEGVTQGTPGLFSNVQKLHVSETGVAGTNGFVWSMEFDSGYQGATDKKVLTYPWAVRSGEVGAAVVPVPAAIWLFGSGLIGLLGTARHSRRKE